MTCMLFNTAMDNREIRRINLNRLAQQFGTVTDMAEHTEIQRPQLSDYLTGKRRIGDSIAMRIENRFSLERGWMDVLHEEDEEPKQKISDEAMQLAVYLASQPESKLEIVRSALRLAGLEAEIPSNVIQLPQDAEVVTDPVEKNMLDTFRHANPIGREFIDAAIRTVKDKYTRHHNNSNSNKSRETK